MPDDANTSARIRLFPTAAARQRMYRENVRAVLLDDGCDPANIEAEIDEFLCRPSQIELPTLQQLKEVPEGK